MKESDITNTIEMENSKDNYKICEDVVRFVVSKVCRLESERMRQKRLREKRSNNCNVNEKDIYLKRKRQMVWFKSKYKRNVLFQKQKKKIRYTTFVINTTIIKIFAMKKRFELKNIFQLDIKRI